MAKRGTNVGFAILTGEGTDYQVLVECLRYAGLTSSMKVDGVECVVLLCPRHVAADARRDWAFSNAQRAGTFALGGFPVHLIDCKWEVMTPD